MSSLSSEALLGYAEALRRERPFGAADYRATDSGNAELFAHLFGGRVLHNHRTGRWLFWRDHRWVEDPDTEIFLQAKVAARARCEAALEIADEERRKKLMGWAIASESAGKITAMLMLAAAERALADPGTSWDADPALLGCPNGVIDLRTAIRRDGKPADRISRATAIPFEPDASCPRWVRFVAEITAGDAALADYLQRAMGYSITGDTREQCLFVCYGGGANGKSTFLKILRLVLGEHAHVLPFDALANERQGGIPNDIAALAGRRFVTASEVNENARLNEGRVKALTGGDPISARYLHQEFFTFVPVAKYWLAVNHKPRVHDDSHGFWRRLRLLPFLARFDPATEPDLDATLLAEAPGILAWCVYGAMRWYAEGLASPPIVQAATREYESESDLLAGFVDDACVVGPDEHARAADLYRAYDAWAINTRLPLREKLGTKSFGERVGKRFPRGRDERGIWYAGVRPKNMFEAAVANEPHNSSHNPNGNGL